MSYAALGTVLNQAIDEVESQVADGDSMLDRPDAGIVTPDCDWDSEPLRSITETPEPGTLALMGLGVGMLFVAVRLRSSVRHK